MTMLFESLKSRRYLSVRTGLRTIAPVLALVVLGCMLQHGRPAEQPLHPVIESPRPLGANVPVDVPHTDAPEQFQTIIKLAETDGMRVTAMIGLNNVTTKPITLKLTLENHRNEDVFFDSSDYRFQLVNQRAESVPITEVGQRRFGRTIMSTLNGGWKLSAGQAIVGSYDLRDDFILAGVAGAYRLGIIRTVRGTTSFPNAGPDLQVEINSIVFNLINAD